MHNHEPRTTNQAPAYRLPPTAYRPTHRRTDQLSSPMPECDVCTRPVLVRRKGRKNRVVEPGCAQWSAMLGGFSRRRADGGPDGPRCSVGFYGDEPMVGSMVRDAWWDGERICHGGLGIVRHLASRGGKSPGRRRCSGHRGDQPGLDPAVPETGRPDHGNRRSDLPRFRGGPRIRSIRRLGI